MTSGLHGTNRAGGAVGTVMVLRCGVRECASGVFLRAERCAMRKTCKPFIHIVSRVWTASALYSLYSLEGLFTPYKALQGLIRPYEAYKAYKAS